MVKNKTGMRIRFDEYSDLAFHKVLSYRLGMALSSFVEFISTWHRVFLYIKMKNEIKTGKRTQWIYA